MNEIEASLGDDIWVRWAELNGVREEFWDLIDEWLDVGRCQLQAVLDRLKRIPEAHCPDYKANRSSMQKPIGYKEMKRELLDEPTTFLHDEIEADDWLGILAGALREAGRRSIVVSGDKDLDQVPGRHWWPWGVKKTESEGLDVLEWDNENCCQLKTERLFSGLLIRTTATSSFYKQVLIGDSTDNIPGCPGVGKVGANKIVDKFNTAEPVECWQEIVGQFEKAHKKKDYVWEPEAFALAAGAASADTSSW